LEEKATSRLCDGTQRTYEDLLIGKFAINKVIRIERENDPSSISENG